MFYSKGDLCKMVVVLAEIWFYRNDPKLSDRHIWANRVDPDQTAPKVMMHLSDQDQHCLPFPLHLLIE